MKTFFLEKVQNESLFRKIYFINILLTYIIFFNYISYVAAVLMVPWAIFLIAQKIKNQEIVKIKNYKILIAFLVSVIVTNLMQIKMLNPLATVFDFVMLIHFLMCFFIFYGLHAEERNAVEKEMIDIMQIVAGIITVLTFFSILFIIFKSRISFSIKLFNFAPIYYCIGMHFAEGVERLSGFYVNPNMIAFCSAVAIIFSHILYIKNNFFNKFSKQVQLTLFLACLILNSAAIILSDSVASFIFISLYAALILFNKLVLKNKKFSTKAFFKNFVLFLLLGTACAIVFTAIRGNFQNMASNVINSIYSTFSTDEVTSGEPEITIGRGKNYNIKDGSGRRHLLKQGLHIFTKNPIMGIGIGNLEKYGRIYFKKGIDFTNFHNGYVSVAVSYGIVGFAIFMLFLIHTLIYFVKALKKSTTKKYTIFPNLAACIAAYCVYSLFEKTMLSEVNFMGVFFWVMLGYTTACASKELST